MYKVKIGYKNNSQPERVFRLRVAAWNDTICLFEAFVSFGSITVLLEWGGILNYFFSISNEVISGEGEMPDFLIIRAKRPYIFPLLPSLTAPYLIAAPQMLIASS